MDDDCRVASCTVGGVGEYPILALGEFCDGIAAYNYLSELVICGEVHTVLDSCKNKFKNISMNLISGSMI